MLTGFKTPDLVIEKLVVLLFGDKSRQSITIRDSNLATNLMLLLTAIRGRGDLLLRFLFIPVVTGIDLVVVMTTDDIASSCLRTTCGCLLLGATAEGSTSDLEVFTSSED